MATWTIDKAHTSINFAVRHMMVTTVRGSFKLYDGTIEFDPANPAATQVDMRIEAGSIETGVADRDGHLRSPDFLDAANYPTITFKSTRVDVKSDTAATLHGDLTIRGVTRPVEIEVEHLGVLKNPWGMQVAGFTGSTKINREDFGLTWNVALETGGWLVGKDIKIELEVEAQRQEVPAETAASAAGN